MRFTYLLHIAAGGLALLSGYVALYAAKGGTLHRRSGMVFVVAMLAMCVAGTMMTVIRWVQPAVNVPAALLTSYLVITSLTTVRPLPRGKRWVDTGLMLVALATGLASLSFARDALTSPDGTRQGMPAFPFLLFGSVALLAAGLDLRMIRSGGLTGAARITRHLWRMSFALFLAAMSFFLGQAKVFPEPVRIPLLLGMPIIAVLITMFYWLWRVSLKQRLRGLRLISRSS